MSDYMTQIVFHTHKDDYIFVESDASEEVVVSAVKDVFYNEGMGRQAQSLTNSFNIYNNRRQLESVIGNQTRVRIYEGGVVWTERDLSEWRVVKLRKPRGKK